MLCFMKPVRWWGIFIWLFCPIAFAQLTGRGGDMIWQTRLPESRGLIEAAEQYRIEYPSVDGIDGITPRVDSAAVFIPKGVAPSVGWPVVVWMHGTVGVAHDCAPSLNARTARDSQYLNTWLSLGFAVVAPDYAGLGSKGLHHYLHARSEAWSTLDAANAAITSFPLQNKLVLVGQSQGAHAAFSSAGYQPTYAPSLNIVATVLTGTPYFPQDMSAVKSLLTSPRESPASGDPKIPYIFYMYHSAANRTPGLDAKNYFLPIALPLLKDALTQCIHQQTEQVLVKRLSMENTVKPNIYNVLSNLLPDLVYPTLKINHAIFIGIGDEDVNVPTDMQVKFAQDIKHAGTRAEVHRYIGLDHSGVVNPSLRDSLPFVLQEMSRH